jgi:hypothetical protein
MIHHRLRGCAVARERRARRGAVGGRARALRHVGRVDRRALEQPRLVEVALAAQHLAAPVQVPRAEGERVADRARADLVVAAERDRADRRAPLRVGREQHDGGARAVDHPRLDLHLGVAVAAIPERVAKPRAARVERQQVERLADAEAHEPATVAVGERPLLGRHAQRPDHRRRAFADVEADRDLLVAERGHRGVDLRLAVPALPVEHLDAQDVEPQLAPVEVLALVEVARLRHEAERLHEEAPAARLVGRDALLQVVLLHRLHAVELEAADLGCLARVVAPLRAGGDGRQREARAERRRQHQGTEQRGGTECHSPCSGGKGRASGRPPREPVTSNR